MVHHIRWLKVALCAITKLLPGLNFCLTHNQIHIPNEKKKKRLFRLLFHQRVWETLSDRIIISNTWQVVTEKSISKMNERRVRISNIWQDNEFHQMTRHRKHYLSKWDSVFYNFEYWLASVNFSLNINTRENNHLRDSMRWLLKTPTVFYVFFFNSQSHCAVVEKSYM